MIIALAVTAVLSLTGSAGSTAGCAAAAADPPPVSGGCAGIRPGALMTSPSGCTMNFVFTSTGTDRYIGTAAHCVSFTGQSVSLAGVGAIGTVVYHGFNDFPGLDFALVKIDASKLGLVNPGLCHWGGPTSLATGFQDEPVVVLHYGHGIGAGSVPATKARPGVAYAWADSTFHMLAAGTFGDSGSAIIGADGKALGVLITIGPFGNEATRLDIARARASAKLGIPLTLMTSPLA